MSSVNTKHKPRWSLPDLNERPVPIPRRVERSEIENESVVLGCREPEEGRYASLSRLTYGKTGEMVSASPVPHDEISREHKGRAEYMRTRHFYLDEPKAGELLISESRGAQLVPSSEQVKASGHDNRANMLLMTSSSIFVSDKAVDAWRQSNSTNRADFGAPSKEMLQANRGKTSEFRKLQQGTHFSLGSSTEVPNSENRTMFTGTPTEKVQKSRINMRSTINIGSPDIPTSETLKSLKGVDFVRHDASASGRAAAAALTSAGGGRTNLQRHNLVLGYQPPVLKSLYGASFTPTVFYEEEAPKSPPRKPRF